MDIFERYMPYLWHIPAASRALALEHLTQRNARGFVELGWPKDRLTMIEMNTDLLRHLGIFEEALLHAYTGSDRSMHHRTPLELLSLFASANRPRLRALGDPLPHPGPYTLYRGVAGRGAQRATRGLSWTGSREVAVFFARRAAGSGLIRPAILTCCVTLDAVFFYTGSSPGPLFCILIV